ncbi:MAG: DUF5685 family protein [Bacilli bacterium]|nr:DUF5685 family protein [Bacilli bacterium]
MYGYIRLDSKANKKLVDYWKVNYCYLCRAIEREFGQKSRFTLSYDVTFLAVLLKRSDFFQVKKIHCFGNVNAFNDEDFRVLAAINVMLAIEMIRDKRYDDGAFWAVLAEKSFHRQEKKIRREFPGIYEKIHRFYEDFREMERRNESCENLANSFGTLMESLGNEQLHLEEERVSVLASVARWLYVIDALDDLDKDIKSGQFNPLKSIASSGKELLLEHQDYWDELYKGLFAEAALDDSDISTFVIRRLYYYSIPTKTAEVMRRILQ